MTKLEVCCYSVECAKTAEQAGADRIELCASPLEGGITPSYATLQLTREQVSIPVHPIVRVRGGDFCYGRAEVEVMKRDINTIRELGFPGVVLGILDEEGHLPISLLKEMLACCGNMAVTFHRAFDMCAHPLQMLQQLADLGVARILTSGQQATAEQGIPLLTTLIQNSQGPIIMPGCGVRASNIERFVQIGATEIHTSAGARSPSPMRFRQPGVTMGSAEAEAEFQRYAVDAEQIKAMQWKISA